MAGELTDLASLSFIFLPFSTCCPRQLCTYVLPRLSTGQWTSSRSRGSSHGRADSFQEVCPERTEF